MPRSISNRLEYPIRNDLILSCYACEPARVLEFSRSTFLFSLLEYWRY